MKNWMGLMKKDEIEITLKINKYSSELKTKHLGSGEWVDEPDEIFFSYRNFQCKIIRRLHREPYSKDEHYFGGYLCGYVGIPKNHPHHKTNSYSDIPIDCHGDLTFLEFGDDFLNWIGFDCAHFNDYTPSIENFKKTNSEMIEIMQKYRLKVMINNLLFQKIYRNIEFCINECKSIVDQLILMQNTNEMGKL
jgi:hypothetical protein